MRFKKKMGLKEDFFKIYPDFKKSSSNEIELKTKSENVLETIKKNMQQGLEQPIILLDAASYQFLLGLLENTENDTIFYGI